MYSLRRHRLPRRMNKKIYGNVYLFTILQAMKEHGYTEKKSLKELKKYNLI